MRFRYNPNCSCSRCRAHGYMGPAVLITLGVLFLLDQMGHAHWMDFGFTWPALLIVIGVVMLLSHSASMEGHIPRGQYGPPAWQSRDQRGAVPPYPYSGQPYPGQPGAPGPGSYAAPPGPVTPPAPVPPAGFITPGTSIKGPDDRGGA